MHAVIVGRLGMHQLGAVGLSNMVFFFVTVFFSFLLVVTTPRVADALAVENRSQVRPLLLTFRYPYIVNQSALDASAVRSLKAPGSRWMLHGMCHIHSLSAVV